MCWRNSHNARTPDTSYRCCRRRVSGSFCQLHWTSKVTLECSFMARTSATHGSASGKLPACSVVVSQLVRLTPSTIVGLASRCSADFGAVAHDPRRAWAKCIDDLVDWYCAKDDLILPGATTAPRRSATQEAEDERRRRDTETDELVANARTSLGIAPSRGSARVE